MFILKLLNNLLNPFVLFNFKNPAGRLLYIWGMVYPILLRSVLNKFGLIELSVIEGLWVVTLILRLYFIIIRRLKDIGRESWQFVFMFVPVYNIFFIFIYLPVAPIDKIVHRLMYKPKANPES